MFHTMNVEERDAAMLRLVTRIESIALWAVEASGVMMWVLMNSVTSAFSLRTLCISWAIMRLLQAKSWKVRFSIVHIYVGRGCSNGTKKQVTSVVAQTASEMRSSMASKGMPRLRVALI